eukprot:5351169-Pyramimonas_sp.AAC.1
MTPLRRTVRQCSSDVAVTRSDGWIASETSVQQARSSENYANMLSDAHCERHVSPSAHTMRGCAGFLCTRVH